MTEFKTKYLKTFTLHLVLLISTLSVQNKQIIILGEDFDGMSSIKWPLQNDATASSNIKNDFYNIDIKDAESYGCFTTAAKINEKGDYTINTKIAAVKLTGTESLFGLVWGAKAKDENFLFLINPAKKYMPCTSTPEAN